MKSFHLEKQYKYVAVPILFWGTLATLNKLLLKSLDAMFVLAVSSIVAFIFLFIYNFFTGKLKKMKTYNLADIIRMVVLGILGFFCYNLFYLLGIDVFPAQEAMILNYMWPAMIIIFSCIILKEKMTFKKIIATMMSIVGVVVVASEGDISKIASGNLKGIIFCLLAAVSYGLYSVLNKKEIYDKSIAIMIGYLSTAIIAFVCIAITGTDSTLNPENMIGLLYNGIACNAISYLCWVLALDYGNTAIISNLAYLTPFISLIICAVVLHENISWYSIIGLVMIVSGIIVQSAGKKKNELIDKKVLKHEL
ncbi:DMT family transporter [[Clostridium] fimetarium]|uniref:Permease of the drug/metabolite transporter (DMT) superfamily n=1 Tax=[Clostridium] fimetarium TaxID=99656 RepID=A0A1I0PWD4_9FIRM|nr:DMT family transporter [[Clostridium] fimetarium]SEW18796.1 Permease of the drug/metabolite transporter (DMT) superfamily [[Clostridium] fimetarium]